ncbi:MULTISPECIES: potassium-transporting ATPase subunit KdpA [unclassified Achromobacter]|uniref:potassium-transporting ATPase subunit KdpA n=1 Tax=unclassified Achromobacter TaxID=2626865 RepID=UPI000B5153F7|nr:MULTISPECIES: potassium-transporting ATPase subunit KdpA [unclassified Achromobacter]OWT72855.1 potassium-transporting ATPase subunit KdpA [Achromobacter sp. HZ34]OWT74073.1 potassium-transporting ATPase subunit KdpA [Achromobacter sp. HZ28]
MDSRFVGLLGCFLAVLLLLAPLVGRYIRIVMEDGRSRLTAWGRPLERLIYRIGGIRPEAEMGWKRYAAAVLVFSVLGALATYVLQRAQGLLPLNPAGFGPVTPDSALNTAISFVTNTNWQGYGGESTMSYLTQMLVLTVQNFVSAATGIGVVLALIRGFARHNASTVGNFWVDMTRSTLYVLLPLSFIVALFFVGQGVIQNFDEYKQVPLVESVQYTQPKLDAAGQPVLDQAGQALTENATATTQTLAMGPVASQEAIKLLGVNGGGFFNANSAHPYENPTALSNFVQMLAILLLPAALCFTFGEMVGDRRQGLAVLASMTVLFIVFALVAGHYETASPLATANPMLAQQGVDATSGAFSPGGNMEGKETRFGLNATTLFVTVTTAASCGAVNAMHDSLSAMGGFVPMLLMQLSEVVFGGVGTGLYSMLAFAILAVFIAGLMIGRTPEYLGKKIEAHEMKMTSIVILATPLLVLVGAAVAVSVAAGQVGVANPGAHGFSEILYGVTSAANNNGSAFAGLSANTPFYNVLLGLAMWFGRFAVIVPILAMAGSLAAKRRVPASAGTMPTHGPLFVVLLIGAVLLVGALTYVPALALGPVAEHLQR